MTCLPLGLEYGPTNPFLKPHLSLFSLQCITLFGPCCTSQRTRGSLYVSRSRLLALPVQRFFPTEIPSIDNRGCIFLLPPEILVLQTLFLELVRLSRARRLLFPLSTLSFFIHFVNLFFIANLVSRSVFDLFSLKVRGVCPQIPQGQSISIPEASLPPSAPLGL